MTEQLPVFATNRFAPPMTVHEELLRLFRVNRVALAVPPSAAIATAYVNPAGFMLLAEELEKLPRIRILLGAEPIPDPLVPIDSDAALQRRLNAALTDHSKWLKAERDAQTIVARTEIGTARRNTNCNLLHSYAAATQAVGRTARK